MRNSTDSVRVVIFDLEHSDEFLILCESDDPDNWKLPGGSFEDEKEPPHQAALREIKEELNSDLKNSELVLASELTNDDGKSRRYIFYLVIEKSEIAPSHEISEIRWVTAENVPECKNKNHIVNAYSSIKLADVLGQASSKN